MTTLNRAVQTIADLIGRPVVVFDTDFAVAAFSIHEQEIDAARSSIILAHRGSPRARNAILEHQVDRASGPVRIPAMHGRQERIVTALRFEDRVIGYLSYVPADGAIVEDAAVVAARDEVAALLAAEQRSNPSSDREVAALAARLFSPYREERETAAQLLISGGHLSIGESYAACVVRIDSAGSPPGPQGRHLADRAASAITRLSRARSVATIIDGDTVLIVPHPPPADQVRQAISGTPLSIVRVGLGDPRAALANVRDSHREALVALDATRFDPLRWGQVGAWLDLGLDRLLLQLPLSELVPNDLPAPVRTLLDAPTGTDLAKTLEAYLDNGADAQRTAAMLHIHRSTLYYRLERIREVIGVDLGDGIVRRELHTGLRVATLTGMR